MKVIEMNGQIFPVIHETELDYLIRQNNDERFTFIQKSNPDIQVKDFDNWVNEYNRKTK